MAGGLTISALNDSSGVLATQNGMSGIAKAWVRWAGSTGTIEGSFNVSSVTRSGTGIYTVNFTTSMPDANYSVAGWCRNTGSTARVICCATSASNTLTASAVGILTGDYSSPIDVTNASVAIFR